VTIEEMLRGVYTEFIERLSMAIKEELRVFEKLGVLI